MPQSPSVVRLVLRNDSPDAGRVDLAERELPFAVTGQWVWDDYGKFQITPDDLTSIERTFAADARRQDLPVVNEDHDDSRAVGWLKGFRRVSDDRLNAIVGFNPVGDSLLANDQYRYVSPELIRNYRDAETGQVYPLVAVGHALTNKPRIKALGPITCAEGGRVGAAVIACSEGNVEGDSPVAAAQALVAQSGDRLHFADYDDDNDDDGPVPPCVYQPPYSPLGCCPGYTRRDSEADPDGDGVCKFGDPQYACNGYRAITLSSVPGQAPEDYSIAAMTPMSEASPLSTTDTTPTAAAPEAPAPAAASAPAPEAADLAEMRALFAAERSERERMARELAAEREERVRLSEAYAAQEKASKVDAVRARLDACKANGRISPAEYAAFTEDAERLFTMSEHSFMVDALEARPAGSAVPFGERGTGAQVTAGSREAVLAERTRAIYDEAAKSGSKISMSEAAKRAVREEAGR